MITAAIVLGLFAWLFLANIQMHHWNLGIGVLCLIGAICAMVFA